MRKAYLLIAALLMSTPFAAPQRTIQNSEPRERSMSPDEADIRRVSENWIKFYNAGDAAMVAALYTEDGYYLSAHILAHGRKEIQAYWERGIKAGCAHRLYKATDALLHGRPRLLRRYLPSNQCRSGGRWAHPDSAEKSQW